ncbi:hypothetical protein EMIHUDRAFT_414846 [Emiliania huxleyi CCMP1516]|uniref:Piwi domain-containing protein n=2 Tax=Emiliania huxleyi TaxID=2903 RepID=A0A0D3I2J3_EMIH1|nr:hypothetical protein EMIHUDRAFT_414846 [Emiliania huxleyi CCMP1516]EOD05478.1 hypothetical protein EMIHUDRAFT_414846 [Emiliania huxleyi CCMP1516]|eukprot:XP_005757907.1 hypothetical protein EMIHUDRAFT_414846 [Emiliania huxleyi CCMP1516]
MAPPFGKGGGKGGKGGGKGGGRGPKVLGTDGSYSAGILLKVNLKLGGANGVSKAMNQGKSVVSAKPTMVIGLDVNHAGRGSTADSHPAICYSLDCLCSKWATEVTSQKAKEELVPAEWLKARMVHAAQEFQKRNHCPVQRLFFYRDGLAHNMFSAAVVQEVAAIKSAMEQLGICPELVYIVVQKRTRARFCMRTPDGRGAGYEKPPYGLVVDREVTDATHHTAAGDFYLSPHFALKGRTLRTPRPAHYHVIVDEANLTADQVHDFTFELCHVYQRATKVVSCPAPVYYAHLAAFQAQYNSTNWRDESAAWETGSAASGGSSGSSATVLLPMHKDHDGKLWQV